ncbi:hypothetical protein [Shumkonia mesophila]|uniref:hypothetical protein n=1 Tax=Shumkonia mesophila TaxID=2838854 RepID=UPI002934CFD3|nr:hypothetical protein [Shumkonia mesophila]
MSDGISIHLDTQQAAAVARAFGEAPEIVIEELAAAAWKSELLLERETKENTPVGIGGGAGLKGSISAREPEVLADGVIGMVGTPLVHAVPVELGTKPHFPPIQPLADWARLKLGVRPEEARSVGYLIARKIAARGTEGAFMFTRALDSCRAQIEGYFAAAAGRILARVAGS